MPMNFKITRSTGLILASKKKYPETGISGGILSKYLPFKIEYTDICYSSGFSQIFVIILQNGKFALYLGMD